jgi:hypothetical protein
VAAITLRSCITAQKITSLLASTYCAGGRASIHQGKQDEEKGTKPIHSGTIKTHPARKQCFITVGRSLMALYAASNSG